MAGGGGAWKVAYADFVTAMMAFFLVMWITSQNQEVREAIAHHFQDPFAPVGFSEAKTQGAPRHSDQAPANRAAPPTEDKQRREVRRPTYLLTGQGKATSIGAVLFFDEGTVEINPAASEELGRLIPWLKGKPQKVEIRGHASRRPLPEGSPYRDAWQLSYARCVAVMTQLEQGGIQPERLRLSQGGAYEAIIEDGRQAGLEMSERVEVRMLDEVSLSSETAGGARQPAAADDSREDGSHDEHHAEHAAKHSAAAEPAAAVAHDEPRAAAEAHPVAEGDPAADHPK